MLPFVSGARESGLKRHFPADREILKLMFTLITSIVLDALHISMNI